MKTFVAVFRSERNGYGKIIRKKYESGVVPAKRSEMKQLTILSSNERGREKYNVIANTITTVLKDNLILIMKLRQATKQGYIEWHPGQAADLSYPTSKLRRGRVQGGGITCTAMRQR